ncbi:MAG: hypothetical protein AAF602_06685, partial [Myxococcota bacterium]
KVDHNQSGYWPTAPAVNMPYGAVAAGDSSLLVADTANSRILRFDDVLEGGFGADATALSGQDHFRMKGDNRWGIETRDSLCWPYNLAITGDLVLVADTGNHRIQLWERAR